MSKIIEHKLTEEFKGKEFFSKKELFDFFLLYEPDLKEGTLSWRIYDLKKKHIIKTIKKGLYTISYKPEFKPHLSSDLIKLTRKLRKKYKEINHCIWENNWLNEFSKHQTNKRIIIIEVEKDFAESIYYYLRDNTKHDLYLNPEKKTIDFYISESSFPIIIKGLISRSPIEKRVENKTEILIPSLEKILVDIFSGKKLFYFYQGSELIHIYKNAINYYSINFTKLFSYARRRGLESEIKFFIMSNMNQHVKSIIND